MPVAKKVSALVEDKVQNEAIIRIVKTIGLAVLLLVCTAYLIDDSFNPFIYFRF
jgi:hypothetical protein